MPGKHAPPEVRFWRHVRKGDGCWEWTSSLVGGYGQFKVVADRTPVRAHRFSWELHHGPIPEELKVLHHCDNPPCVRPDHLFIGTTADNTADMVAKGRQNFFGGKRGPGVPFSGGYGNRKLTDDDIAAIRLRRGETARAIARDYGVAHTTIVRLLNGTSWNPTTTEGL